MILKIGTRGSKLAIAQSNWVKEKIESKYHHVRVELIVIKTTGDKILDSPLSKIGEKGLFVKEIEESLLSKQIHVAVHSLKDVPAELPEGLTLSAFPQREAPGDAFISSDGYHLEQLPKYSRVGTGSLRRSAQMLYLRPDLDLVPLRGNIDTRLEKLKSGELQAIVLAAAGLRRLGLANRITHIIPMKEMLPAVGQGALGLEVRCEDQKTIDILDFINHNPTEIAVRAERAFLKELEGGCQVPIGAFGLLKMDTLHLDGMVAETDGSGLIRDSIISQKDQPEEAGIKLARRLLNSGADRILSRIYGREIPRITLEK